MQIVVDASALLAVLLAESHREGVLAATRGVALCAPASLPWEIGNALSSGLKRGRFPLSVAHAAATAFEHIAIRPIPVDLQGALDLADTYRIYAYDAYMMSACQKLGAPLLTLDVGLRRVARAAGISLIEVPA